MYWRTKLGDMNATSSVDWPRNGAVHEGSWTTLASGERWVVFANGHFLPEKQKGFTILFDVTQK